MANPRFTWDDGDVTVLAAPAPLTDDERAQLNDLLIRAAENDDAEAVEQLAALADRPDELRELLNESAEPPVAESLARLVNEWLAEGGAAPPARATFPGE